MSVMAKGDTWQVINASYLRIRSGPGTAYTSIGGLSNGETVIEITTGKANNGTDWVQHSKGWSAITSILTSGNTVSYMKKIKSNNGSVTDVTDNIPPDNSGNNGNTGYNPGKSTYDDSVGAGYQPNVNDMLSYTNSSISNSEFVKIKNVTGVFGLPYQFLPSADVRLSGDTSSENIGYEYADRIVTRMPLMFITPGKASFMTKFSKKNKQSVLEWALSNGFDSSGGLDDLLTKDGRYYTFEYDRARYYRFVNPMCRIASRFLEIQDMTLNGSKLDTMDWGTYTDNGISAIFSSDGMSAYGGVPFYIDTDTSVGESFSNTTTQSMLASTVNSVSDMGRELNFLFGYTANALGGGIEAISNDADIQDNINNINDMIGGLLGSGSFFDNLSKHLITVASGGKLVFPEIWSDSSFNRSYNINLKLRSPDPSKFSVFINVLVPLFHLLGLVSPQTDGNNPNGYTNPFLIRAVYKGFFNVDMGIITDMSITKGAECQWTSEGIPTSIDISINIKDLYSAMSITETKSTDWKYDTLNNTAQMDYIANLCGINIFKPEIGRTIDMWFVNNFTNRVKDLFAVDIWKGVQDRVQNFIMNIYR
jgi:uncharacterized protein YraI